MDKENKNGKKTFMDTVKAVDAEQRRKELEEEAKQAEERARIEEKQRREYEERLKEEKLELMKLKQGIISEDEIPKEKKEQRQYSAAEKVSNFFYHNKYIVIVSVLFIALAAFLTYDYLTKENPDITALYIAADPEMSYYCEDLTPLWSGYAQDYNEDDEKIARLYYVPTGYADNAAASMAYAQSDRTKLMGEFQSGTTIMMIGDKEAFQSLGALDGVFYDCTELFPDDPYAEKLGYRLSGTDFKELIDYPEMEDDLYVVFRTPCKTMGMSEEKMQVHFDRAVEFWRGFLEEHRVDGLELEEIPDPEPIVEEDYYYHEEEQN